jgi:hypothetical protein
LPEIEQIMIQRIQSVYLLVSAILMGFLFKLELAELIAANEIYSFVAAGIYKGEEQIFNGIPLLIMLGIIVLLQFVIIFSFKKRIIQMRMTVFTIVLLLGMFGAILFFAFTGFDEAKMAFKLPVAFPLVAAILDFLAIRAIGKDEALIRSLNRIR